MDKGSEGGGLPSQDEKMRDEIYIVPSKSNHIAPWEYDEKLYKGRNVVERYFRNIKQYRRVFTRYDK
jgi:hypothetical protein